MKGVPTSDDIILSIAESPKPGGKVARWIEDNPDESRVFLETVRKAKERGIPFVHAVSKCKEVLGGPPGSMTTIRSAVKSYAEEEV